MNRSEELAKLLGIKLKSLCDGEECHTGFPCYICEANKAKYYPDFTNPSNFIKLLDIFGNILFNGLENTIDEMLWRLDKLNGSRYIANVKQQAQQTDWTY